MKQKIAITLDKELVVFLDEVAQRNRSEYLNKLLVQHRQQIIETQLIEALKSDVEDAEYQQEIKLWDEVVGDGINAQE
jgi:metal-responsive CopG/Arc/MetJ family transcriptional regulator